MLAIALERPAMEILAMPGNVLDAYLARAEKQAEKAEEQRQELEMKARIAALKEQLPRG